MDPHLIELPRKILIGKHILPEIKPMVSELGLSGKAVVLTGKTTAGIAGEFISRQLSEFGSEIEIVNEATSNEIRRLEGRFSDVGFVAGVGGGKTIDVAKLFAYSKKIPFFSVPTAPSHDGIASERASLKTENSSVSVRAKPPIAILADVEILINAPYRLIASGCADAISNYTSVYDWKLAMKRGEYYSKYASYLALISAEIVTRSADLIREKKERGIRDLMEALITSSISMSMVQSSRPASGAEHSFSHALDHLGSNALHGEQCGVGSILMAKLQGQDWENIRDALKKVGAPTTARELGVDGETIIRALVKAKDVRDRYTILDKRPLNEEKARKLCIETGVIDRI